MLFLTNPSTRLLSPDNVILLLREAYTECKELVCLCSLSEGRNAVFSFEIAGVAYVAKSSCAVDARLRLTRHACMAKKIAEQGVAAEQVLTTSTGALIAEDSSGLVVLVFRKVQGVTCEFTRAGYKRAGKALASWHTAAAMVDISEDLLEPLSPTLLIEHAESTFQGSSCLETHSLPLLSISAASFKRLESCISFLRSGLCDYQGEDYYVGHGDPHPLNLLYADCNEVEFATWIDLEDAYRGTRLHDLGTLVWSTLRSRVTKPLWMAALEAYDSVIALSETDLGRIGYHVALRQLWWLSLHARHWGQYSIHHSDPRFLEAAIELLEIICSDACGATLPNIAN